eukprot:SAG31_NODE_33143_length_347_cov_0.834677_1_plen_105_part_10
MTAVASSTASTVDDSAAATHHDIKGTNAQFPVIKAHAPSQKMIIFVELLTWHQSGSSSFASSGPNSWAAAATPEGGVAFCRDCLRAAAATLEGSVAFCGLHLSAP